MPIDALMNSPRAKTALTGFLGGAAGGALAGALTKKKGTKKLLKAGGLVALGGVAWSAYQKYKAQPGAADLQSATRVAAYEDSSAPAAPGLDSDLLFQAMVAAGYADGHLTSHEQTQIWRKAVDLGVSGDALARVESLLQQPPPLSAIVASAGNMDSKLEVYSASVLIIDTECEAGQDYLERLRIALGLPQPLADAVQAAARGD